MVNILEKISTFIFDKTSIYTTVKQLENSKLCPISNTINGFKIGNCFSKQKSQC